MFEYTDSLCVICRISFQTDSDKVTLTDKGVDSLLTYSDLHKDDELRDFLLGKPDVVNVHRACRLKNTSKRRYEQMSKSSSKDDEPVPAKNHYVHRKTCLTGN